MRKVLEKAIHVMNKDCPAYILQKIETHLRKKRNVVADSRDLEDRKQREGETFQEYLIAVTCLVEEADVTAGHCDACQKTCLDMRLASRIISGIRDGETRRKLLDLSPFPTLDKVKEICTMGKQSTTINAVNADAEKKYPRRRAASNQRVVVIFKQPSAGTAGTALTRKTRSAPPRISSATSATGESTSSPSAGRSTHRSPPRRYR